MDPAHIEVAETPQVVLTWSEKEQGLAIDAKGVKSMEFMLAMLEMARIQIQFKRDVVCAGQLQAQQVKMQQDMALAQRINRNGGRL